MTSQNPYQTPEQATPPQANQQMQPCIGCGKELHITAASCPHCGASQRNGRYKNKTIAAVFAFFLGGFGAHRFYLGQWWGLFYLLFFWTYIPGLIALIEFVVFLVRDQHRWDEKYNEGRPAGPNEKTGAGSAMLLVVVGLFVFIFVIGILAAIAIPQYQNYITRSKVARSISQAEIVQEGVFNYINEHSAFPENNADLNLDSPYIQLDGATMHWEPNHVVITFEDLNIEGKEILITADIVDNSLEWTCLSNTLEEIYLPPSCRN